MHERHQRTHFELGLFICHVCGKSLKKKGALVRHVRNVHEGRRDWICDICGKGFPERSVRDDHRRTHTGECPYVCHTCGKTFKTMASLCIHNKVHINDFPHHCPYCPGKFRWKTQLNGHLTTHTGEKKHKCEVCGKAFGVKCDLNRHKHVHSDEKPYSCTLCGCSFSQKRYLKKHEKARHRHDSPLFQNWTKPFNEGEKLSTELSILAGIKQENDEFEDEKRVVDSADLREIFDTNKEKLFRCNVCLKSYAKVTSYEAHLRIHNKGEPKAICNLCGENFASVKDLKIHTAAHIVVGQPTFPCQVCGQVFLTSSGRQKHKLEHLTNPEWSCELCARKFNQHSLYVDHILMHKLKKELQEKYACSECRAQFDSLVLVTNHMKIHCQEIESSEVETKTIKIEQNDEEGEVVEVGEVEEDSKLIFLPMDCNGDSIAEQEETAISVVENDYTVVEVPTEGASEFICGECGVECSDLASVTEHMKGHYQEETFQCFECQEVFDKKVFLLEHCRTFHPNFRPYSCDVCSSKFASKSGLRNHRTIHMALRYACDECGHVFKGRSGLYLHKQRVHRGRKDFACEYCGKLFALKCQRDNHQRVHTGEKPFKCETCGAGFKAQSGLYAHRKTHTDERPYECEVCGKRLRLPYNLRLHMRTHTGEKPYLCDICGRAFSQPGDCKKHKKTHRKHETENEESVVNITYMPVNSKNNTLY